MHFDSVKWMIAGVIGASVLAGCGGGSSNAPAGFAAPAAATLSGTVQDSSGSALAGYQVVYDVNASGGSNAALTVTTDGAGHYTLTVPASDITGNDTLSFFDSYGSLAATQSVTPTAGTTSTTPTMTINLIPPPIAPLAVAK